MQGRQCSVRCLRRVACDCLHSSSSPPLARPICTAAATRPGPSRCLLAAGCRGRPAPGCGAGGRPLGNGTACVSAAAMNAILGGHKANIVPAPSKCPFRYNATLRLRAALRPAVPAVMSAAHEYVPACLAAAAEHSEQPSAPVPAVVPAAHEHIPLLQPAQLSQRLIVGCSAGAPHWVKESHGANQAGHRLRYKPWDRIHLCYVLCYVVHAWGGVTAILANG